MSTDSPNLSRALSASIRDAQLPPRDAATVALARRYAALIEEAKALADALDAVEPDEESQAATLERLKARVQAHVVASDLGPKLLAALTSLGMNPSARATAAKGGVQVAVSPGVDALAKLRARKATNR